MPEGPEVRKFGDILRANIINTVITKCTIKKGRYLKKVFDGYQTLIDSLPVKIIDIVNKGKFTYMILESVNDSNKVLYLLNSLGMGGAWTVLKSSGKCNNKLKYDNSEFSLKIFEAKRKEGIFCYPRVLEYIGNESMDKWFQYAYNNLNVQFELDNGDYLNYHDQRNFGTIKIIDSKKDLDKKLNEIGSDVMFMSRDDFIKILKTKINSYGDKYIGNIIVNQKIISGIGNYLRADILYMSKISPFRKLKDVNEEDLVNIYQNMLALIWGDYNKIYGIKKGYIKEGIKLPNDYNRDFFVYMQDKDINGYKVIKNELFEGSQKRFIHWVKEIQV